jgi:hypothetical protein
VGVQEQWTQYQQYCPPVQQACAQFVQVKYVVYMVVADCIPQAWLVEKEAYKTHQKQKKLVSRNHKTNIPKCEMFKQMHECMNACEHH